MFEGILKGFFGCFIVILLPAIIGGLVILSGFVWIGCWLTIIGYYLNYRIMRRLIYGKNY